MEFTNVTSLAAGYTTATDKTGREHLVVVAKATYSFPSAPGAAPERAQQPLPLIMTDTFTGEPGFSSPLDENDFAPCKPRCDVLLKGSAHAPEGQPVERVRVGLRVGQVSKSFDVVGNRSWYESPGFTPSEPEPFSVMPLSYDVAYGGVDQPTPDPATHRWYPTNPVGRGFRPGTPAGEMSKEAVPNTEEIGEPIRSRDGQYRPMAFGPLGRSWQQRLQWAGTYDARWREEKYPFLPDDFDERYFQAAPEDQQTDYLRGGEDVVLLNLTPSGRVDFKVPKLTEVIVAHYKSGTSRGLAGVVDTLFLEPDAQRFSLTLRASMPLGRSVHELRAVEVGRVLLQPVPNEGEEQTPRAKPHYTSLSEFVNARLAAKRAGRGWP